MTTKQNRRIGEIAEFWNVNRKTVQRWKNAGHPIHDTAGMCDIIGHNPKTSSPLLARVAEVRAGRPKTERVAPTHPPAVTTADIQNIDRSLAVEVDEISAWIVLAESRMQTAMKNGDEETFTIWDRVRRNYSDQKVKNLLAQAKLGLESGELVGKSDLARLFTAFASAARHAIYRLQRGIAPKLVGLTTTRQVVEKLEGPLFLEAYIAPFEAVRDMAAGIGLPSWVVDELVRAYMDLVEEEPGDPGYSGPSPAPTPPP